MRKAHLLFVTIAYFFRIVAGGNVHFKDGQWEHASQRHRADPGNDKGDWRPDSIPTIAHIPDEAMVRTAVVKPGIVSRVLDGVVNSKAYKVKGEYAVSSTGQKGTWTSRTKSLRGSDGKEHVASVTVKHLNRLPSQKRLTRAAGFYIGSPTTTSRSKGFERDTVSNFDSSSSSVGAVTPPFSPLADDGLDTLKGEIGTAA